MRYLVKAKVKSGKEQALVRAIDEGTLGRGSIAGNEYLHNMREARTQQDGVATWVECCFCDPPLDEERAQAGARRVDVIRHSQRRYP